MHTSLNHVIIIGEPQSGDTELLRLAFVRLVREDNVEVIAPKSYEVEKLIAKNPSLILFVLDGTEISSVPDGLLKNCKPGVTVIKIWDLIDRKVLSPIHVAVPSERFGNTHNPFTALDALAMSLSGISGIWEISPKLLANDPEIVSRLGLLKTFWSTNRIFLFGKPSVQLYDFYMKVNSSDWPTTKETLGGGENPVAPLYVKYSFQTALALAGLTVEDMSVQTSSSVSLEHFADRLMKLDKRTGLVMGRTVLVQTLRYLDRGWSERIPGYDKKRRNQLPVWARVEGFPANLPLIRKYEVLKVSEELYKGLESIDFERDWDSKNPNFTTISVKRSK